MRLLAPIAVFLLSVAGGAAAYVPDGEFAGFSADCARVVASDSAGVHGVFATGSGRRLFAFPPDGALNAVFSADGSRIATSGPSAAVWSAKTGRRLFSLDRPVDATVLDVAFNAEGTRVAASYSDGAARIWNVSTGRVRHALIGGHNGDVNALAWDTSGTLIATTGRGDGNLRVWDARTGYTVHVMWGWQGALNALTFSPDGKLVAGGTTDGLVVIRKASPAGIPAPPHARRLRTYATDVFDVRFSPDSREIVAAGEDGMVRIWRVSDGRLLHVLPAGAARVLSARFSPDGHWVATGDASGRVSLFAAASGRPVHRLHAPGGAASVAFCADGRLLLASGDRARVWSVPDGRLLRTFG